MAKPIDLINVNYGLLKAGDTLRITGKPHYGPDGQPLLNRGDEVMVEKVHPAGVTVKSKAGVVAEFYFEHGAEKLQYTDSTKKAIQQRAEFGKPSGEPKGTPAE